MLALQRHKIVLTADSYDMLDAYCHELDTTLSLHDKKLRLKGHFDVGPGPVDRRHVFETSAAKPGSKTVADSIAAMTRLPEKGALFDPESRHRSALLAGDSELARQELAYEIETAIAEDIVDIDMCAPSESEASDDDDQMQQQQQSSQRQRRDGKRGSITRKSNHSDAKSSAKGNKKSSSQDESQQQSNDAAAAAGDDAAGDESNQVYCLCKRVSYGAMVACDSDDCRIEWFHFACVGLIGKPKGRWLCPDCKSRKRQKLEAKSRFNNLHMTHMASVAES